ncbi:MAG: antitoxin VapB family protein [Candidatus Aenigmarchaeota archaeon]|nr:antitoxin VapB family protein [Candidatus Aenigmarchaeota archaeon]
MPTKTISVLEEVYKELLRHKKSGESFSDELRRLVYRKGKISECAGLWSWMEKSDIESIERAIAKRRKVSALAKKGKMRLME